MPKRKTAVPRASTPVTDAQWEAEALSLRDPPTRWALPWPELLEEALLVARAARQHWQPDETAGVPGLSAVSPPLSPTVADEIIALHRLASRARWDARASTTRDGDRTLRPHARKLLSELRGALGFHFGPSGDPALSRLRATHRNARSADAMAAALIDYAALVEHVLAGGASVPTLDPARVAEARAHAQRLHAWQPSYATMDKRAKALRDGLTALLMERVRDVRGAAGLVFREHPELLRRFTSAYERERRAASRRAKREEPRGV